MTCRCNHCDWLFVFEAHRLEDTVTCPKCGMPTKLYMMRWPEPRSGFRRLRVLFGSTLGIILLVLLVPVVIGAGVFLLSNLLGITLAVVAATWPLILLGILFLLLFR